LNQAYFRRNLRSPTNPSQVQYQDEQNVSRLCPVLLRPAKKDNSFRMKQFVVKEVSCGNADAMPLYGNMILQGDSLSVLRQMASDSVQCVVTSPPYWGLRDYHIKGQIGLEESLPQYLNRLVAIFNEVRRVLRPDGLLWLNIGDGYTSGNRGWRAPDKKKSCACHECAAQYASRTEA